MPTRILFPSIVLLAATAAVEREAAANGCNAYTTVVANDYVPLGCPIVVYVHPDLASTYSTQLTALRGLPGQPKTTVPIAATVDQAVETFQVSVRSLDDACVEHTDYKPTDYRVFTITPEDALIDDVIQLDGGQVPVTAAGPCPTLVAPTFYCNEPVQPPCDPVMTGSGSAAAPGDAGCSTSGGGGSGLPGLAFALGLVARARPTARGERARRSRP